LQSGIDYRDAATCGVSARVTGPHQAALRGLTHHQKATAALHATNNEFAQMPGGANKLIAPKAASITKAGKIARSTAKIAGSAARKKTARTIPPATSNIKITATPGS